MPKARAGDGQPRSNKRQRSEIFRFRILSEEREQIEKLSGKLGLAPATYARRMALNGGKIANPRNRQEALAALVHLAYQLRKLGTNVNTIAHAVHAGTIRTEVDVDTLHAEINALARRADRAICALGDEP